MPRFLEKLLIFIAATIPIVVTSYFFLEYSNTSNVLQNTSSNFKVDLNLQSYFRSSLKSFLDSFETKKVDEVSNVLQASDENWDYRFDVNVPSFFNNLITGSEASFELITVNNLQATSLTGLTQLDEITIRTIEQSIEFSTQPPTDDSTFGGLEVTDFLRSNEDTVFSNGILTFENSATLKFNNISPSTFLSVDSGSNVIGYQILPGLNVEFTSTATSLTINSSTQAMSRVQAFDSVAVSSLFYGTSSFDSNFLLLSGASDLNKLYTLSGSLLTTNNLLSFFSAIDTDATNDITNSNFSSTLFTLFPNIDTNASNDVDLLQDAVLIGSGAGKNVYSENIWFGYQNFNRASASLFEVETNGKIQFNGGVLPAIVDNSIYSYDDVIYFQENPIAILSDYNLASINNKFAFFTTNAFGKLQLGGASEIDVNNLTNALSISASNITMALGYTPLKNTSDTMSGSLTILQTLSSQDLIVSNSLFVGDYVNSAYTLQIEPKVGSLNRRIVLDLLSGSQTETTLGMYIQSVKFSAPSSSELKNITFNQISSTNDLIVDFLKAGTLPSVLNGVLDTYNSQVSAASLYLAANTTNTPQIRFTSSAGVDLSSPTSGDLWFNGTELNFYNGSETINLLSNPINYFGTQLFSGANSTLADGDYIEVTHNADSYDVMATGWVYNTITSKWEQVSPNQGSNTTLDLMEYSNDNLAQTNWATISGGTIITNSGGTIYFTDSNGLNSRATPYIGGYVVHRFTGNGTFTVNTAIASNQLDTLVIGGGGSGGRLNGGGGGAGDAIYTSGVAMGTGSYTITVGAGGASLPSAANNSGAGNGGGSSSISGTGYSVTAGGGCGGAGWSTNSAACSGNGGGQGGFDGVSGTPGTGNFVGGARSNSNGGGGAGHGGNGGNASGAQGGNGGVGVQYSIEGVSRFYAGGGGGGGQSPDPGGTGGSGVGGNGSINGPAGSGVDGTGSGGGGGGWSGTTSGATGKGGDGAVIIRYQYVGNSFFAQSESTIKQQGAYATKFTAVRNQSLNDVLRKTFSPALDLTNQERITFSMRASRTGQQIRMTLTESTPQGNITHTYTPNILQSNTWQTFSWNLSSIPNNEKDNLVSLDLTVLDDSADNTFYIDDLATDNNYKILLNNTNTARLYNFSNQTQNMRLVVSAKTSSIFEFAGFTPLRNDSDYMRGSLGVNDSFSAASARFSNLFATNFSATTGNITNLTVAGSIFFQNSSIYETLDNLYISNPGKNVSIGAGQSRDVFFYSGNDLTASFNSSRIDFNKSLTILGDFNLSDAVASINLRSSGSAGNNAEVQFFSGASNSPVARIGMDWFNTFEFEGGQGVDLHFNVFSSPSATGEYRFWQDGNNRFEVGSEVISNVGASFQGTFPGINAPNIKVGPADNTFEGGHIDFVASGTYPSSSIDIYQNISRWYTISTTDYRFQIENFGSGTAFLTIRSNRVITASTSDLRLKEGIEDYSGALGIIEELRPVSFNYKNDGDFSKTNPERQLGFIAQDIENIIPSLVTKAAEIDGIEYKGLDYGRFTPLLVAGIQEQQDQIDSISQAIANINVSNLESLYNQLLTTLENLSMSTENGALVVNTNLTVTGEALFNNATFTGNVEIGQVKIDSLENDISIKAASCVDMDGNMNQEACDSNKLNLMQNKAGNVEMFDGQVKFKPNGEILGEKVIGENIQADTFKNTPSSAPAADSSCNSGEFKFAEEDGKAYVFFCKSNSRWVRSELSSY